MNRRVVGAALASLALAALACVTINVYFPEAEIKDLSQQIEEQVRKQALQAADAPSEGAAPTTSPEEAPAPEGEPPAPGRPHVGLLDQLLGISPAYAAGDVPDPDVSNPAIRKIISSRAARLGEINKYKSLGVLGENNQALLEIRDLAAAGDLKTRANVQRLVREENGDREEMFREMAVAKGVDAAQIPRIRETYAATLRENAAPGEWIQTASGLWQQKK